MKSSRKFSNAIFIWIGIMLLQVVLWNIQTDANADEITTQQGSEIQKNGDAELAYLLVKLEKKTRQVIAGHYGRAQVGHADNTSLYKNFLIRNLILPAAVADPIFSEVVPQATSGRAWVKMVVPNPRNQNNTGDATALDLVKALQKGVPFVELKTADAHYYGEPIVAKAGCLECHGKPAGESDPYFPVYKKNGWEVGEVIGGVIARVAPK